MTRSDTFINTDLIATFDRRERVTYARRPGPSHLEQSLPGRQLDERERDHRALRAHLGSDVRLPGLSGLDLQLKMAEYPHPIIFITGHGDIPMTVRAMRAGAVEFLTKPFRDQDLLDAIQQAVDRDRVGREQRAAAAELRSRFDSLTPRESEVFRRVVTGLLNKQIAGQLGTSGRYGLST